MSDRENDANEGDPHIDASMRMLHGDAAIAPLGTPDVYVDDGAEWACPCGGLKVGPTPSSACVTLMSWQCPGCGTIVAIRPPEPA